VTEQERSDMRQEISVTIRDYTGVGELTPWQNLFLSAIVGEPIPHGVLLSALEDAGVYPNGLLTAVGEAEEASRDAPIEFVTPVYDESEAWPAGENRADGSVYPFMRSKQAEVYGLCKGVLGQGKSGVGNLFSVFIHQWFGRRSRDNLTHDAWRSCWPTDEYIRDRIANFPPLGRILRHLRRGAKFKTAETLTRLIDHLDGQRG
jgi:hypothetical protein